MHYIFETGLRADARLGLIVYLGSCDTGRGEAARFASARPNSRRLRATTLQG
jgi:hypothetical protein